MEMRVFNRRVRLAVDLEYSLMAWARDWQIHPNFTVRTIVPPGSEAYNIMSHCDELFQWSLTQEELTDRLKNFLTQLLRLFEERKAWPTDVTDDGSNLLHVRPPHNIKVSLADYMA